MKVRFLNAIAWLNRRRAAIVALFVGVCVPLLIFGMLADSVLDQERVAFDLPLQTFVHGHATLAVDQLMLLLSRLGSAWVTLPFEVLAGVLLLARRRTRQAVFWVLAVGGAGLLNLLAKHAFARARPTLWISPAAETTFSFPSGHAMHTGAIVAALLVLAWPTAWRIPVALVGGLFMLGVGLSRIYLGVHFPSDVLAAWVASMAWVVGLGAVLRVNDKARTVQ